MSKMKTDPDIDEVVRDLVEWMDGWEWYEKGTQIRKHTDLKRGEAEFSKKNQVSRNSQSVENIKQSLDLVREIEVVVYEADEWMRYEFWIDEILVADGDVPSKADIQGFDYLTADPKPRLIALHRTLVEANEIQQEADNDEH